MLRIVPAEEATPTAAVTITFDRPAAGGRSDAKVYWSVDDVPHALGRWSLRPGRPRFRAISASGDSAEVTVRVE